MKKKIKFPEISLKEQQSIFGAWGSSGSDQDDVDGGWLDEVDLGTVGGGSGGSGGSDSGSAGDWNDWANDGSSSWGDGGPGDDYGGGGSGGNYDSGQAWWALNNLSLGVEAHKNASLASNAAAELAKHLEIPASLHNGYGDAFRHALWSAMNTEDIGFDNAIDVGQAHENSGNNPQAEIDMDLNNNAWGAYFAENNDNWTIEDFLDAFNDAIESGDIIINDGDTIPEDLDIDFDFSDNTVYGATSSGPGGTLVEGSSSGSEDSLGGDSYDYDYGY